MPVKAWWNWKVLFVQHQYLELGHFCLPVSPAAKSAWQYWQTSTEQSNICLPLCKMCLPNMKCLKNWWWQNEQARTGSWNYLISGKRCWSVSPSLKTKKHWPWSSVTVMLSRFSWYAVPFLTFPNRLQHNFTHHWYYFRISRPVTLVEYRNVRDFTASLFGCCCCSHCSPEIIILTIKIIILTEGPSPYEIEKVLRQEIVKKYNKIKSCSKIKMKNSVFFAIRNSPY